MPTSHTSEHLTWHPAGSARQQCANVAVLAGHNCDGQSGSVRYVKQNGAVLPGASGVGPGVVDVDLHRCLAQELVTQHIANLHPQVKCRTCGGGGGGNVALGSSQS